MSNITETSRSNTAKAYESISLRQAWGTLVTSGAEAWNVSRRTVIAILFAPVLVAISGLAAAACGKAIYKIYTEEDGVAETLQVLAYAAAWVMCFVVVRYRWKSGQLLIAALYIGLACGLFFLIGEEVSWGQRVFGWGTPESLAAINKQEETNLHNIYGVGSTFKWVQMLVGAYGTVLPLCFLNTARWRQMRPLIDAVVPHVTLIPFFLPMLVWRAYRNFTGDPSRFYYLITNYNEVIELILALGFMLFLVFQVRKCRREMATTAHGS